MRVAVIADIHGNALALEAVLSDIRTRGVDRMVNLGDLVSGPLWPAETLGLLAGLEMPTVRGNHDRWVAENDLAMMGPSDIFTRAALSEAQLNWLGDLPGRLDLDDGIVAFHATPEDDNRYLIEDVRDRRLVRADPAVIQARLGDMRARVVLCGHSHLPHVLRLADGTLVVNPGSVGCPAYDDPTGDAHVSEAGSPHARYAVLSLDGDRVGVEMIALEYPWEEAARRAEAIGRPQWAMGLRTGFLRG